MKSILLGLTLLVSPCVAQGADPNILFILVDDLGWSDLACYGNAIHETNNIDTLASQGMRFTNAYAPCPICAPTRAAIMTGKFPARTGFVDNNILELVGGELKRTADNQYLDTAEFTFAESFKAGGYQTAAVGKWHMDGAGAVPESAPTNQGFDVYVPRPASYANNTFFEIGDTGHTGEYLTDRLTTEALAIMTTFNSNPEPWMMYMSYHAVHLLIQAKQDKIDDYQQKYDSLGMTPPKAKSTAYAAMCDHLDENVGRLLQFLDDNGIRDNTIVVLTSDNGGHRSATDALPLRGHKGTLYEGGIRVPLIIDWPGVTTPGSVCSNAVHGTDFYATLLEMAELPAEPLKHVDSVSLVPLLDGSNPTLDRGPMLWHYPYAQVITWDSFPGNVVVHEDWKYIEYYDGRRELYNLITDIGESANLFLSEPVKAAEMKLKLETLLIDSGVALPPVDPDSLLPPTPNAMTWATVPFASSSPLWIIPTNVLATAGSGLPEFIPRPEVDDNLINGSGLTTEGPSGTHDTPGLIHWRSRGNDATDPATVELVFDLGGTFDLTNAYLWQYNDDSSGTDNFSVQDFDLEVSTDGGTLYTQVGTTRTMIQNGGGGDPALAPEVFALVASGVTHVKIDILSCWDPTGNNVGLSEVRFEGAQSSTSISMTATTAADPTGGVEYYFEETSGNAGGTDSGWQSGSVYIDQGLTLWTEYTYTVTTRDAMGNLGAPSIAATARAGGTEYETWAAGYPGADLSDPNGDIDGDGLTNNEERLWGLDPTTGSSVNPLTTPLDSVAGTLTYTRRTPALSGASYSYQWSTTLEGGSWTTFTPASEVATGASPVESVTITLDAGLLANTRLFLRVAATENAP